MTSIKSLVYFLLAVILSGCGATRFPPFNLQCKPPSVAVTGFAQAFVGDARIAKADIRILEKGQHLTSNQYGQFGLCSKPNSQLTFLLTKKSNNPLSNFKTTQTATIPVHTQPLTNKYHEVTFQVPRRITYRILQKLLIRQHYIKLDPNRCNVATTIAGFKKTLEDDPQGEAGAIVILKQRSYKITHSRVIYFGILFGKTNPFSTFSTVTSEDGGVILYNVFPSKIPYTLTAEKHGKKFSRVNFICRKGAFINLSPPYSPTVINE